MWDDELAQPDRGDERPEADDADFNEVDFGGIDFAADEDARPWDEPPAASTAPRPASPPLASPVPRSPFPHVVTLADVYQAAHARAVADHELTKLFNPDYDI